MKSVGAVLCVLSVACLSSLGSIGQEISEPPAAPGGWVVPVSAVKDFNEPSIAIDRNNPLHLVAAFQGNASVSYSKDAGKRWTLAEGTASTRYKYSGDVSITYDNHDHAILCYIAMDKLGTSQYWGHDATRNGVFTRRSIDGGATWEKADVAVLDHPTRPGIPFEDKPYIVADNNPHSPYFGNLYIGWTQDRLTDAAIVFSRSTDDAKSWSNAIQISDASLPRDDNGMTEGFDGVVTRDGTLHAIWSGENNDIQYTESRDGGRTFAHNRQIVRTGPPRFRMLGFPSRNGVNGYPQIAAIPGKDRTPSHLYVTWSDFRYGEVDVFCIHSDDEGKTWSKPVKVNSDPAHDGADHFFQWLAADPTTGAVYVSFYDRRKDPTGKTAQVTLARSVDDGDSFKNYSWGVDRFNAMDVVLGDYTGLTALNGCVYGVWTETRPAGASSAPRASHLDEEHLRFPPTVVLVGGANFNTSASCGR
jgi:hypothetical protein